MPQNDNPRHSSTTVRKLKSEAREAHQAYKNILQVFIHNKTVLDELASPWRPE